VVAAGLMVTALARSAPPAGAAEDPAAAVRDSLAAPLRLPEGAARAAQTGWLRPDRLQHASLAWTLGVGAGATTRETSAAIAVPMVFGLAKELHDSRGPGFDAIDLIADLAGSLAAGWFIARRVP